MANLETILSWFQTGDKPTQEEFKQTFSSFRHKDTNIPIAEVYELESSLNNKLNVDDLPSNMALVDEGQPANVFNKEQITAMAMMLSDYVKDGKIRADKIEALGLTDLIQVSENTLTDFAKNADKYEFQQNDFIAVPDDQGNFSLLIYKGGDKFSIENYLPTGLTNITMGMVEGLQSALNTKLDKPEVNGNYFVKMNGTASYQSINPGSDHLLFWNGSEFKNSNIFRESSGLKYGIGTTTPSEQLHLTSRARMSGLVLENNTETLPQQLTYNNKKFFGTDDSGVKRPLMFADNADFLSLANSLTDTQKTAWKTAMNGGWTTGTMSVFTFDNPIINKNYGVSYLTLIGANLNFNPLSFSVKIVDKNSTSSNIIELHTVPNSQVILSNSQSLSFWFDYTSFNIGTYKILLNNGVASYLVPVSFDIVDSSNSIILNNIWSFKNLNATTTNQYLSTTNSSVSYKQDTSVYPFSNTKTIIAASQTSALFNMAEDFSLEITDTIDSSTGWGRTGGMVGFFIGSANETLSVGNNCIFSVYYNDAGTSITNNITTEFGNLVSNVLFPNRIIIQKKLNFLSITFIFSGGARNKIINVDIDSTKFLYVKALYTQIDNVNPTWYNRSTSITKANKLN